MDFGSKYALQTTEIFVILFTYLFQQGKVIRREWKMFVPVTVPSSSLRYEFITQGGDIEFEIYLTSKHIDKKGKYVFH